jgi:hypothetical protein
MSKFRISSIVLVLALATNFGCETDIDIIASKKDMTIIYALLEANQSRHYLRINSSFVGESAASILAAEPGNNEYSDDEILQAEVREVGEEGNVRKSFPIKSIYISGKEEGIFFSDSNKVYYFDGVLDYNYDYELYLRIKPEGEEEKEVTAITNVLTSSEGSGDDIMVTKPRLTKPCGSVGVDRDNGEVDWVTNNQIRTSWSLKWSAAENASSYISYGRFFYSDRYPDGTVFRDSVLIPIGVENVGPNSDLGEVEFQISPTEFFQTLGREIPDYDPATDDFERVASDTIQFFIEISNEELATYVEINKPATDVVQERPEYTNVNNGIGIFASRYVTSTVKSEATCSGRILNGGSLEELLYSNTENSQLYTANKNFKNPRCLDGGCD